MRKLILEFLNQNIGAFSVLFSGLVALATVVYAVLTWKLVSETKKMRKVQTEPKICVFIQPREEYIGWIDMILINVGTGPSYDLKFEVEKDFEYAKGKFFSNLGFIKDGIGYMAPGQKLQFFLTALNEDFDQKIESEIEVTVSYNDASRKRYEESFNISFSQFKGLSQLDTSSLSKITRDIEIIKKDFSRVVDRNGFIKIISYTPESAEIEYYKKIKEMHEEFENNKRKSQEKNNNR
ncbi:MAG TPA: hypothetical protein PK723_05730 [Candidatus Pacearchaeota archaeon]|nr:hypothetical protein [Candidatus Pacearchaeota archaeon]